MFLTLNTFLFFALAIPVAASSVALAFVRINETSLVSYALFGISYLFNPKQYIFKKEEQPEIGEIGIEKEIVISDENKE